MTIQETLVKFGLEEKEAKVYLASLELGPAGVAIIAKKAEIKRPTAYLVLDTLIEKGFVTKSSKAGKVVFTAEKPESLMRHLKAREQALQEAMPMLKAVMQVSKKRPKVSIYEGKEGIRQVYQEIFQSNEIWWFGSIKDINKYFSEAAAGMVKASKNKNIKVRDLITDTPDGRVYAGEAASDHYELRFMPKGMSVSIDCAIFGTKVAILSVVEDFFVVVIESPEVAASFRSFHELAWQSAKPFRKK